MIKREILEAAIAADAANSEKYDKLKKTALLLLDYIDVISAELNETAPMAHQRGWRSSRVEEGRRIREALGIYEPRVQGGRPELRDNLIGEKGNCSECGALVERLYSLRCPACYDKLVAGQ